MRHVFAIMAAGLIAGAGAGLAADESAVGHEHGGWDRGRILEKYDANKNGQLDPEEKEAAKRDHEAKRAEMLKRFDTDGDGKLSDSEREAMRQEFRKERGEKKF